MKRFALFFSLFMLCLVVKANPVSRSQALKEAKSFLATKGVEMNTSDAAYRAPRKANAQEGESSYYYIFNVGNDEGFVIVSGDDRTEQILGYSDSGSFDEENMPEPLKEWLDGYAKEMESIIEVDANEYESLSPRRAQEKTKKSIAPMTTSKWASGYPFNLQTPLASYGHTPVGCSPVAFAQLIYYHRANNPAKSTAVLPYYSSKVTFDWNNMLDEYISGKYNTTQANAVANLMIYTGRSLSTNYSNGSTTSKSSMLSALPTYFGFDKSIALIDRDYYSADDWDNIIYNELANGRPVLHNGLSTSAGHTFIVDGYDSNGLFHINWGWAGLYDGYFLLSVTNRYSQNSIQLSTVLKPTFSYNRSQSALIYLSPLKLGSGNCGNGFLSSTITNASSSSITCSYVNQSGLDGKYLMGLGCVGKDGKIISLIQANNDYASLNNTASVSKTVSLSSSHFKNKGLDKGKYVVFPIYKKFGDTEWHSCQYNKNAHLDVIFDGVSSISTSLSSNFDISATSIKLLGNEVKGNEQIIKATLKNNSKDYGFTGKIYFFASKTSSKESLSSCDVNIGINNEIDVEIPFTPSTEGTYNIWLTTNSSGTNVIGNTKVVIYSGSTPSLDISNVAAYVSKNWAGVDKTAVESIKHRYGTDTGVRAFWGNTFSINITGIKNTSSHPIKTSLVLWLREYDKSLTPVRFNSDLYNKTGENASWKYIDITVPAKSTIEIPIIFEGLKYNSIYDIRLEYKGGTYIFEFFPMLMKPAVTTWKADGTSTSVAPTSTVTIGSDVVAVDITDATAVTNITPSSNPNILYYLGANQKVPTGIANLNVVKGDVAEKITLVDNKNFFVPKRFTAKSINFTTQPKEGVSRGNNNHWTTIALPFEVTSVRNTTDNEVIDWFHSDNDTGKNFWIRKFDRLDTSDNTVIFENAEKMLAYEPYIMNVPDDYWGKKWDLRNKNITFYGENAVLHNEANIGTNSSYYNFVGTTLTKNVDNGWLLNDAGDTFKYVISGTKGTSTIVSPFHAYFMLTSDFYDGSSANSAKSSLRIKFDGDEDSTTGIMAPFAADEKVVDVYNLNGVKVASKNLKNGSVDMSDLPKGIYVVNGKKFIQY